MDEIRELHPTLILGKVSFLIIVIIAKINPISAQMQPINDEILSGLIEKFVTPFNHRDTSFLNVYLDEPDRRSLSSIGTNLKLFVI